MHTAISLTTRWCFTFDISLASLRKSSICWLWWPCRAMKSLTTSACVQKTSMHIHMWDYNYSLWLKANYWPQSIMNNTLNSWQAPVLYNFFLQYLFTHISVASQPLLWVFQKAYNQVCFQVQWLPGRPAQTIINGSRVCPIPRLHTWCTTQS